MAGYFFLEHAERTGKSLVDKTAAEFASHPGRSQLLKILYTADGVAHGEHSHIFS